jgi:hypothetical protein
MAMRVKVRRVMSWTAGRGPWKLWLRPMAAVLAVLIVLSLLLSAFLMLLPWLLLGLAVLLAVRWMARLGVFGGKGPVP